MERAALSKKVNHFRFRRGIAADFLADLDDGGGGVASIFRKPSSKLNPWLSIGFDLAGMTVDWLIII
jgi:hypothetical protein